MSDSSTMDQARPTVKRTYGRPKAVELREASSSSDLTSLSQLSYSKSDNEASRVQRKPVLSSDAEEENGADLSPNDSGYFPMRAPLEDLLKEVDERDDASIKLFSSPIAQATRPVDVVEHPQQHDRPRSPSSSSPIPRHKLQQGRASAPATEDISKERTTSPTSAEDASEDDAAEEQVRIPGTKAKKLSTARKALLDSDDSEADQGVKKASTLAFSDDEDDLPTVQDAARIVSKPLKKLKDSSESDEEEIAGISQKTEDIEQYQDSEEEDGAKTSKGKRRNGKAPRAPSKKDLEQAQALVAAQARHQHASIISGTRAPKPISSYMGKAFRFKDGPVSSASKSSHSNSDRARSASVKPILKTRPVISSLPAKPKFSSSTASKPIEIGSSSVIFDADQMLEDSYDPSYLQSVKETAEQTQYKKDVKPAVKSATPAGAMEDDDEELPDLAVEMEKQRKARALAARKAEAVQRQRVKQDQKEEKYQPEMETAVDYKGKGKARAKTTTPMMDLDDTDGSELEVVIPKAPRHVIEKKPNHPHTQRFMKTMIPSSVKLEPKHEVTESQIERAGRTFGRGYKKTLVAPHVANRISRNKPNVKAGGVITKQDLDRTLLAKFNSQAAEDRQRRVEDWKKRGGTLRTDHDGERSGLTQQISVQSLEDGEEGGDSRAKTLMDQMREDAEQAGNVGDEDDDDDEEDEDYLGSGDEKGSEDENENEMMDLDAGSGSEADEEGEDEKATLVKSRAAELDIASPSGTAATEVASPAKSGPTSETEEESEAVFRRPMKARAVVVDDEDSSSSPKTELETADTSKHDFSVQTQAAFPTFDNSKIGHISLTQAFGNPEDSQSGPMPSKAVLGSEEGFGELFDDTLGFDDSQMAVTPSQAVRAELPEMFQNNNDTPVICRHQLGEAPMILDAALRDAEMREDVEKAYYDMQQRKAQAQAEAARQRKNLTTTPGSTTSEEYEPLPMVTELIQRHEDRLPRDNEEEEEDDAVTQTRLRSIARSEASTEILEESQDSPSAPRRRLIRADQVAERSESPEAPRILTAFDLLKQGAAKTAKANKLKEKRKKANEYVAEQADESEEEGMYSMMRKSADGEGDNDEDSDLDGSVEDLVDDEKVDGIVEEEQDELARERFQQDMEAEDAKNLKVAQKVVAGDMKKRKKGMELDDSDYEDDEMMFRKAKARKPAEFNDKTEAIAANPTTAAFGESMKDHVSQSQDDNAQYLALADDDAGPASEMEPEEGYESDGYDDEIRQKKGRHGRTPSPDLERINKMVWERDSPATLEKPRIKDNIAAVFLKPVVSQKPAVQDDFGDIDMAYSYKETQTITRRVIQFDKEDSQNDRGVGPGKSSAVTSFVKKGGVVARASSTNSIVTSQKLTISTNKNLARSNSTISAGGRGRLAQARLPKK